MWGRKDRPFSTTGGVGRGAGLAIKPLNARASSTTRDGLGKVGAGSYGQAVRHRGRGRAWGGPRHQTTQRAGRLNNKRRFWEKLLCGRTGRPFGTTGGVVRGAGLAIKPLNARAFRAATVRARPAPGEHPNLPVATHFACGR